MITALDHIAIAVPDLEKAIERFMTDFGLSFDGTEDVTSAKTKTAFFVQKLHFSAEFSKFRKILQCSKIDFLKI